MAAMLLFWVMLVSSAATTYVAFAEGSAFFAACAVVNGLLGVFWAIRAANE